MDFLELKQKKERGVTNAEFMDGSKEFFEKADSIVVVGINPDGIISTFYTQSTSTNAIGMMEIAKQQLISELEVQPNAKAFYFAFLLLTGVKEKAVASNGVTINLSGCGVTTWRNTHEETFINASISIKNELTNIC